MLGVWPAMARLSGAHPLARRYFPSGVICAWKPKPMFASCWFCMAVTAHSVPFQSYSVTPLPACPLVVRSSNGLPMVMRVPSS